MSPEERRDRVKSYGRAFDRLEVALLDFPRDMWTWRAGPGEWSIHEIIVHLADSEANGYVRCRRLIAEPGSHVLAFDEPGWASALDYHRQNAHEALELFRRLRQSNYALIRSLPDEVWANSVIHSEGGHMTFDDWLHTYERHVPEHIAQMRAVYQTWRLEMG